MKGRRDIKKELKEMLKNEYVLDCGFLRQGKRSKNGKKVRLSGTHWVEVDGINICDLPDEMLDEALHSKRNVNLSTMYGWAKFELNAEEQKQIAKILYKALERDSSLKEYSGIEDEEYNILWKD